MRSGSTLSRKPCTNHNKQACAVDQDGIQGESPAIAKIFNTTERPDRQMLTVKGFVQCFPGHKASFLSWLQTLPAR